MVNIRMRGLRRARRRRPAAARGVAGLRGVPRRLAVVAERRAAPRRQARQLRTRRAARRYHRETAVGRGAPPRVRVGGERASHRELFVLLVQHRVVYDATNV